MYSSRGVRGSERPVRLIKSAAHQSPSGYPDLVRRRPCRAGLMEGTARPDYKRCVAISTQVSLPASSCLRV
jgi:hypothetical protein